VRETTEPMLCSNECHLCDPPDTSRSRRKCRVYFGRVPWLLAGGVCPYTNTIMREARRRGGACDCVAKVEAALAECKVQCRTASEENIIERIEDVLAALKGDDS
jgi:hypothetical protein